jgi:dienelactone hydrolase
MVHSDAVVALAKELTEAGADWQIHAYGHTGHGFTNPNATAQIGIPGVEYQAGRGAALVRGALRFPRRAVWLTLPKPKPPTG